MRGRTLTTEKLELLLAEHRLWLESYGEKGARADFTGFNLSGKNLRGTNLRQVVFRRTRLIWADFSGSDLTGADLSGAVLNHADLSNANLTGAKLRGAVLRRAKLEGTNFHKADVRQADFRDTLLAEEYPSFETISDDLSAIRRLLSELSGHLFHILVLVTLFLWDKSKRLAFRRYIQWKRWRNKPPVLISEDEL